MNLTLLAFAKVLVQNLKLVPVRSQIDLDSYL